MDMTKGLLKMIEPSELHEMYAYFFVNFNLNINNKL